MPLHEPTTFKLLVDGKAKALGPAVPPTLRAHADEVIGYAAVKEHL